jgi:hypothetical protein
MVIARPARAQCTVVALQCGLHALDSFFSKEISSLPLAVSWKFLWFLHVPVVGFCHRNEMPSSREYHVVFALHGVSFGVYYAHLWLMYPASVYRLCGGFIRV